VGANATSVPRALKRGVNIFVDNVLLTKEALGTQRNPMHRCMTQAFIHTQAFI
jgi:hypothetical protein